MAQELKLSPPIEKLAAQARSARAALLDVEGQVERTRTTRNYDVYCRARAAYVIARDALSVAIFAELDLKEPGVWPWMPDTDCPY